MFYFKKFTNQGIKSGIPLFAEQGTQSRHAKAKLAKASCPGIS
jgi:hypothetical protein